MRVEVELANSAKMKDLDREEVQSIATDSRTVEDEAQRMKILSNCLTLSASSDATTALAELQQDFVTLMGVTERLDSTVMGQADALAEARDLFKVFLPVAWPRNLSVSKKRCASDTD